MKATKYLSLAAIALAGMMASCQSDDEQTALSQIPQDGVMRFTANLVDPAVQTRASITGNDLNQNGQQFQVKIVNPNSATYSYFNTVQYDGTEWRSVNRMLWQNDQQMITVTAAYLQGKTFTDNEFVGGTYLDVAVDQNGQGKLNQQDLLTMPTKNVNPQIDLVNGKLVINFYHALSKLDVTLDLANEFYTADPKLNNASDITEFTIKGTNVSYSFQPMQTANENYGTVDVTASTAADILAYQSAFTAATDAGQHSHATYEAILVPQQIAAGQLTISFKVGTRSFSWTNDEAITLEQGKRYTLPITVGTDGAGARAFVTRAWE